MTTRTHKDLHSFARRMRLNAKGIENGVNKATGDLVVMSVAELAKATPVDTGRARSNWQVSGSASATPRPAFSPFASRHKPPYAGGGSRGEGRNLAGAVWAASAAVARRATDAAVYIVNPLPYIQRLNQGHSPQAGAGWISRALAVARARWNTTAAATIDKELK